MLATGLNRTGFSSTRGRTSSIGCNSATLGLYSANSSTWSTPWRAKCSSIGCGRGAPSASKSSVARPPPKVATQSCQSGEVGSLDTCVCASTSSWPSSISEPYVVVLDRQVIDADAGRGDPAGELGWLVVRRHQLGDLRAVIGRRQPAVGPPRPVLPVEEIARRADVVPRERADLPVEPFMRKDEPLGETGLLEFPVPAPHPALAVGDVLIAQVEVERGQQRDRAGRDAAVTPHRDRHGRTVQQAIIVTPCLHPAALESCREIAGLVRRGLGPEQVERDGELEVQVLLD